ncbi:bifunctional DNA primase/polymerase [Streptomyces sp. NPDC058691]|uniref:bifunctional DNA primase/polymerase n=1 Tax=Streptomyces sp. NPDC058691 TaxID=3346601 RepID=UPI0036555230
MTHPDFHRALACALAAARRGFPVIPLSRTKLPAVRSPHRGETGGGMCRRQCGRFGHGVHDASTDPVRIGELFAAAPWASGYGIACGRAPHYLIGLDLDRKGGADGFADLVDLAARQGFAVPWTRTVLTPSGGRHLWLTGPAEVVVPNSVSRLGRGIDVRGSGGYLVGPGSVTVAGRYRWDPPTASMPPAAVPRRLLRLLMTPSPKPWAARAGAARAGRARGAGADTAGPLIRFVLGSLEGERNERLFWAACRAYENGHGEDVAAEMVGAAVRTGLPEREAAATVGSARRHVLRGSGGSGAAGAR